MDARNKSGRDGFSFRPLSLVMAGFVPAIQPARPASSGARMDRDDVCERGDKPRFRMPTFQRRSPEAPRGLHSYSR